ncbi:MAG: nucleotidyltransferase domain-containing protein [bacterium]|nr:nucleotidyltransferase domain-containing protein [bacterium]
MESSGLTALQERCGVSWNNINRCRDQALEQQRKLESLLNEKRLVPADTCLVVFGSLARREWTSSSDLDWTLLVDGPVDPAHATAIEKIKALLAEERYIEPGPTGTFGSPVFSHQLVHRIGGEEDSNRNTTQRILLLIESAAPVGPIVRERVVRQLLKRYVDDDNAFRPPRKIKPYVPHFFLNDVVRYWRTMGVDLVQKLHSRGGDEWALRSFKLRMSRKLLFAAGLTMSLDCKLNPSERLRSQIDSGGDLPTAMASELFEYVDRSPLEILAGLALRVDAIEAAKSIFGAYDDFLGVLSNEEDRQHLKTLTIEDAPSDKRFNASRETARRYQEGLEELFFGSEPELASATKEYGVF